MLDLPLGPGEPGRGGGGPAAPAGPGRTGPAGGLPDFRPPAPSRGPRPRRSRRGWILLLLLLGLIAIALLIPRWLPPILSVEPAAVDFEAARPGEESEAIAVVLSNPRIRPLTLRGVATEEGGEAFRVEAAECQGAVLSRGSSCRAVVAFTPSAPGDFRSRLVATPVADVEPVAVVLAGTGVAPRLEVEASSVQFGMLPVGQTSAWKPFELRNAGTAPLEVTRVALEGAAAAEFGRQDSDCDGVLLAVGEACSFDLRFAPRVAGDRSARLRFSSDTFGDSPTVDLRGTGGAGGVGIDRTAIDFGQRPLGDPSREERLKVTNAGNLDLEIRGVVLQGGRGEFTVVEDGCGGQTLSAGDDCAVALRFEAGREGDAKADLEIRSDAPGPAARVGLTGRAVVGRLRAERAVVDFGTVVAGRAAEATIGFGSEGSAPVKVRSVVLSGGAVRMVDDGCRGRTLSPRASCEVRLLFRPTGAVTVAETLTVGHDGLGGDVRVDLRGTGVPPPRPRAGVDPNGVDFGVVAAGGRSGIETVRLRNEGEADLPLRRARLVGRNAEAFSIIAGSCEGAGFLPPDSECTVGVRYQPASPGEHRAAVELAEGATVTLTGSSP